MSNMYCEGCPEVAVIILNWNGAALLREYLPQVVANTDSAIARVIVADNGSTDDSRAVLENEFPGVERLYFDENHGFAEGYNLALKLTQYPYTVLLNSDVAPAPGWIEPLYSYMKAHPDTAACQPKLLSYKHPDFFEYAGACGGYIDRNGFPYCRGRIFGVCEEDHDKYNNVADVHWASGAALFVRTGLYLKAGGLDARFFAHMEEIDLCWRLRLMGYRIAAVPRSTVFHLGGGSLPASNPRKTYLNFRNNLLMLYKNLPPEVRDKALVRRRMLDTLAWARFAVTFDWGNARAVWKAHRDFAKMRVNYADCRAGRNMLEDEPNILVEYYLKGHKKFSQLKL